MAEESKAVAKNIGANPNPNQMLTMIVLGLIILLILLAGGAIYIILTWKVPKIIKVPVVQEQQQQAAQGGSHGGSSEKFGELVPLNEFVISLASTDTGSNYLKANVTLEVAEDEKIKEEMQKRVPQFQDLILSIGGSMTAQELEKNEGKNKFRSEILNEINKIVGPGKVRNVFFTEYYLVVQ